MPIRCEDCTGNCDERMVTITAHNGDQTRVRTCPAMDMDEIRKQEHARMDRITASLYVIDDERIQRRNDAYLALLNRSANYVGPVQ